MAKRTNLMSFRTNDNEYLVIKKRADQLGMTMGKFMRTSILDFDSNFKISTPEVKNKLHAMTRIGNNLNQIAKTLNQRGSTNDTLTIRLEENLTKLEDLILKSITNDKQDH